MHFSMNFVFLLSEIVDDNLTDWLGKLGTLENVDQGIALSQLAFAGLAAYDQEEGNDVDYNAFKVRDWLYNALEDNPSIAEEMLAVMEKSFSQVGKKQPKKVV